MSVIKVYHEVTLDNATIQGDRFVGTTFTDVTQLVYQVQKQSIAATNTSQILWQTLTGGVTTFVRGLFIPDQDIWIELRTITSVNYNLFFVNANQLFWFGPEAAADSTAESLDGAVLVDGTDYDDIDRIEVQNEGATAAIVSLFLFS